MNNPLQIKKYSHLFCNRLYFLSCFRFTGKLSTKYRAFSYVTPTPFPVSSISNTLPGVFVTINKAIFMPYCLVKPIVNIWVHFCGLRVWTNVRWHVPTSTVSCRIGSRPPKCFVFHLVIDPDLLTCEPQKSVTFYCLCSFSLCRISSVGTIQYAAFSDWLRSLGNLHIGTPCHFVVSLRSLSF